MTVTGAFASGLGRVRRAAPLITGLWLVNLTAALPLALTLYVGIGQHLGSSLAADSAFEGVNHDWWNEYLAQATGVGQTFVPAIIGFAAVLRNVSMVADAQGIPPATVAAVLSYLALTLFLTGGVLDRLARDRRVGTYGFFAACGTYFFRLVRLTLIAAVLYGALFAWLHPWLFDSVYTSLTRDLTVERTAMLYRFTGYLLFAMAVALVNVLFDYGKVRLVVEDRRSALGAISSSARFIIRYPGAIIGLYVLNTLVFLALVTLYALLAPGAAGGFTASLAVIVGQLYVLGRLAVRLLFAASELSLFQGRLAHAGYTAAPVAAWPDSPAAEAVIPQ